MQQLSSVYNVRYMKGLYLMQWLSSEIKLRGITVQVENIKLDLDELPQMDKN